jgi:hypothetical protein
VIKVWVRNAKIVDIKTPANIAPITAINKLPVTVIKAKPDIAPIIIIPSTPKLRTPDLSVMSSPQEAKIKGTAEAMIDVIISPIK